MVVKDNKDDDDEDVEVDLDAAVPEISSSVSLS